MVLCHDYSRWHLSHGLNESKWPWYRPWIQRQSCHLSISHRRSNISLWIRRKLLLL
jgi:hypothetical protein